MRTEHSKVTFANRYGITLAANLYRPKDDKGKLPAIAVSGPFGAVKEQSSGLYAQEMAASVRTYRRSSVRAMVSPKKAGQ